MKISSNESKSYQRILNWASYNITNMANNLWQASHIPSSIGEDESRFLFNPQVNNLTFRRFR